MLVVTRLLALVISSVVVIISLPLTHSRFVVCRSEEFLLWSSSLSSLLHLGRLFLLRVMRLRFRRWLPFAQSPMGLCRSLAFEVRLSFASQRTAIRRWSSATRH